jgi:hypothetical protein
MVELAIAMPVVLVVMIAAVQFALYYHARNVTITAVQEGARFAAAEGRSLPEGEERARSVLESGLGGRSDGFDISGGESLESVVVRASGFRRLRAHHPLGHRQHRHHLGRGGSTQGRIP